MTSLFRPRHAALSLALIAALSLTACQTSVKTAPAAATAASQPADRTVVTRAPGNGLYEMAYSSSANALYVASADRFKEANGGVVYRLDPVTLATQSVTYTDLKNFGIASDEQAGVFYTTNSLDGAITKLDAQSGKVLDRLVFPEKKDKKGYPAGTREMLVHEDELYVGRIADPGFISVVNARTFKLKKTLHHAGKWVTGLIYSPLMKRIYAANGSGEILVINPRTHNIEQRWTPGDGQPWLFLNMAEDPATGRLFVTDNSKGKATLVFDERSGKVIHRIDGDALAITYSAVRHALFISQRESKKVLELDATTFAVKHSWSFNAHPNSLLLSPDHQTLYVTLKQKFRKGSPAPAADEIARIALDSGPLPVADQPEVRK